MKLIIHIIIVFTDIIFRNFHFKELKDLQRSSFSKQNSNYKMNIMLIGID